MYIHNEFTKFAFPFSRCFCFCRLCWLAIASPDKCIDNEKVQCANFCVILFIIFFVVVVTVAVYSS